MAYGLKASSCDPLKLVNIIDLSYIQLVSIYREGGSRSPIFPGIYIYILFATLKASYANHTHLFLMSQNDITIEKTVPYW